MPRVSGSPQRLTLPFDISNNEEESEQADVPEVEISHANPIAD